MKLFVVSFSLTFLLLFGTIWPFSHLALAEDPDPSPTPTPTATPTPSPSPTPEPSPSPTPTPTPSSSPTPTPTPVIIHNHIDKSTNVVATFASSEQKIAQQTNVTNVTHVTNVVHEEEDEDLQVAVTKTDHLAVIRPDQQLEYVITVNNPLDRDIEVDIVDTLPGFLIPHLPDGVDSNPRTRTITWRDVQVDAAGSRQVHLRATVESFAPDGFVLRNTVFINGDGIYAEAYDDTTVQSLAPAQPPAPAGPAPVPVTARTGASGIVAIISALLSGSTGLAWVSRRFW